MASPVRILGVVIALVIAAPACASDDASPSASDGTAPVATATAEPGATGTPPASPDVTGEEGEQPPPAAFGVRGDGIGDLPFGSSAPEVVIDALRPTWTDPPVDETFEFPTELGGSRLTADEQLTFPLPFGRRVCWPGFCAFFGGQDAATLTLVGWDHEPSPGDVRIYTDDGITAGTRWSEALELIEVEPGGCPHRGFGSTIGGVHLGLEGGDFTRQDNGTLYDVVPTDPAAISVYRMTAGFVISPAERSC